MRRKGKNHQAVALVALGLILKVVSTQKIELDKNIELNIEGFLMKNKTHSVLPPFFGKDQADSVSGQKTDLIADLTYDHLLLPRSNGSSYGVRCEPELLCDITGLKEVCKYGPVSVYDCQSGSTLLRYKDGKAVDANVQQIEAYFYNSTQFWESQLGKHGIFGMSPSSPIWNYFATAFNMQQGQEAIETSLCYRVKDYMSSVEDSLVQLTDSFFTVNGRYGINEPVLQRFKKNTYSQWVYEGATLTYNRNAIRNEVNICVDNTQNVYFFSKDAVDLKRQILKNLCDNETQCHKSQSNMKKIDPLIFQIGKSGTKAFSMSIKPEEFINFDASERAIIAIGDIADSKCKDAGDKVDNGIGRLMLTKIELIVRIVGPDSFDIGFNEITYPKDTIFLIILIVLGVIIVLVILGIIIASIMSQKRAEEQGSTSYAKHTAIVN